MFKVFSIIIFFICIASTTTAQSFNAGIQGGLTGTQVTGDQLSGFNKAGLFAGLFVNHEAGRLGDLQMEFNFIQKGSRKNAQPDKGIYDSYLMRLNYLAVPVFYRFNIKSPLTIETGLEFAYLISAKEFDEQGQVYPDPSVPYFRSFDLSGFAGLGVAINDRWRFVFRYSYSIIPIRPRPSGGNYYYAYWNAGQYNSVLLTTFQYQF